MTKEKLYDPMVSGLPCDLESERMVLGSVMIDGGKISDLRDILAAEDFSSDRNRTIWGAFTGMYERGEKIDRVTLATYLHGSGSLEKAGGISYLSDLDDDMPIIANLDSWAQTIKRKSVKRKAIMECHRYMLRLSTSDEDASEIFTEAGEAMARLNGELVSDTGFSTPMQIVRECGGPDKYLDSRRASGVQTPWQSLNNLTGGFREEELIILAAHTARGKTAMALNIALHAAKKFVPVAVFSMEMSRTMINDRFIAINGRFDGRSIRRPERDFMSEEERSRAVINSLRQVADLPLYVCDQTTVTVAAIEGKLRRLMAQVPIGLVIIDYIQLASGVGKFSNRADEVSSITRALKRLAASLKVPIVALSQFNRDSARDNREPEKHDLRESGSIEQDANLILAIHFTRLYDVAAGIPTGDVKLKILKQRSGPEGWLPFTFHAPSGVFYEQERA